MKVTQCRDHGLEDIGHIVQLIIHIMHHRHSPHEEVFVEKRILHAMAGHTLWHAACEGSLPDHLYVMMMTI